VRGARHPPDSQRCDAAGTNCADTAVSLSHGDAVAETTRDGPFMSTELTTTNQDDGRIERMHRAYTGKVNALVAEGRDGLSYELAEAYRKESAGEGATEAPGAARRSAGWTRRTREAVRRFDRYTLDVFNPGTPYRPRTDRSA
jgi:hypothetical protein